MTKLAVIAFGAQGPLRTQRTRLLSKVEPPTRSPSLVTFSAGGQARPLAAPGAIAAGLPGGRTLRAAEELLWSAGTRVLRAEKIQLRLGVRYLVGFALVSDDLREELRERHSVW